MLHGEPNASRDDVATLAYPVLGHRLFQNFHADAEGIDRRQILREVVALARERARRPVRRDS
jgi:MoxR-like ATPase